MSSNAIKITAVALVILALILVFVAYRYSKSLATHAAAQQQAQQQQNSENNKPTTLVVVATKPLPAQVKIGRLEVELVPVQVAPPDYLSNVDDAIGRIPLQDVGVGTPLTKRLFTENNPLAHSIPAGTQALSLRVDDVIGTGGFVRPGDHVDVLLYLRSQTAGVNNEYKVQTQARVLLKDALVLAYQDLVVPPPKDMKQDKDAGRPTHAHTAVLAVPDADTTRVMLGASLGELRLALLRQVTPPAGASAASPATAASVTAPATQVAANTTPPATTAAALKQIQGETQGAAANNGKPVPPASAASVAARDKVITLEELGFIQAKQQAAAQKARGYAPRAAAPRVVIYRGDKAQTVRP